MKPGESYLPSTVRLCRRDWVLPKTSSWQEYWPASDSSTSTISRLKSSLSFTFPSFLTSSPPTERILSPFLKVTEYQRENFSRCHRHHLSAPRSAPRYASYKRRKWNMEFSEEWQLNNNCDNNNNISISRLAKEYSILLFLFTGIVWKLLSYLQSTTNWPRLSTWHSSKHLRKKKTLYIFKETDWMDSLDNQKWRKTLDSVQSLVIEDISVSYAEIDKFHTMTHHWRIKSLKCDNLIFLNS